MSVYKYLEEGFVLVKILIIGGSGVIGTKMLKYYMDSNFDVECTHLKHSIPFAKSHYLDITKRNNAVELITKINPDVVIHLIALTNVDLCEKDKLLADLVNVNGTENVIEGCKTTKSKIVYISTSFVFDGKKKEYFEDDVPSPSTYYGITKHKGEELVRNSPLKYLILRIDAAYCWNERWQRTNSVLRAIETLRAGKILKEITDWYNTPTYAPQFVSATAKLIDYDLTGIFHVVGPDFINRYNWSLKVAEIFGLNKNMIEPINSSTLNLAAKRVNVKLNNRKLFKKTGLEMLGVEDGLVRMLKNDTC